MIALLLMLGCGKPDPELIAARDAIAAFERGKAALDEGEPGRARTHFGQARELRPRDGLLFAWEARAAAAAGDYDTAVALLEEGLALQPGMAEARYNLAAYLVRDGRFEEAAPHLARALADGELPARGVLEDPDFAEAIAHPAFSFLPVASLEVELSVPDGSVFWGSQTTIELVVHGARQPVVDVTATGPVDLVSGIWAVEGDGADRVHRYAWTVLARGQSDVVIEGSVHDGERSITVDAARFETSAPPGKPLNESREISLPDPSLGEPVPLAGGAAGEREILARTKPAQKVVVEPEGGRLQRFELRQGGSTQWTLHRWVDVKPGSYEVVVTEPGRPVVRQPVTVSDSG